MTFHVDFEDGAYFLSYRIDGIHIATIVGSNRLADLTDYITTFLPGQEIHWNLYPEFASRDVSLQSLTS